MINHDGYAQRGPRNIARAAWRISGWLGARATARFVRDLRTEWARAGRVVHWGPVSATCVASLPGWPGGKVDGALGLVDGGLVFVGRQATVCDGFVPFQTVRWVVLRRTPRWRGGGLNLLHHLAWRRGFGRRVAWHRAARSRGTGRWRPTS